MGGLFIGALVKMHSLGCSASPPAGKGNGWPDGKDSTMRYYLKEAAGKARV